MERYQNLIFILFNLLVTISFYVIFDPNTFMVGCIFWWFCFSLFYLAAIYKIPVVSGSFLVLLMGRIVKLF